MCVVLLVQANRTTLPKGAWEHGQNRRNRDHSVPPLPLAREGRGLLVQANREDVPDRRLAPAAESTVGTGAREARRSRERGEIFQMRYIQLKRIFVSKFSFGDSALEDISHVIVCWEVFCLSRSSPGGPGMVRARQDLSNALYSAHGHAGLSKSM